MPTDIDPNLDPRYQEYWIRTRRLQKRVLKIVFGVMAVLVTVITIWELTMGWGPKPISPKKGIAFLNALREGKPERVQRWLSPQLAKTFDIDEYRIAPNGRFSLEGKGKAPKSDDTLLIFFVQDRPEDKRNLYVHLRRIG